jgi:hypothetical protein
MQLALFTDMPKRPPKIIDVSYSPGFELFWRNFPRQRRTDKPGAWRSYQRAVRIVMGARMCDERTAEQFLAKRATDYAESDRGMGEYAKMPATWLNQHCWDDEPEVWSDQPKRTTPRRELPPDLPARDA